MFWALLLLNCRTLERRLHSCSSEGLLSLSHFLFIIHTSDNVKYCRACQHCHLSVSVYSDPHCSLLTIIHAGMLFAHWKLLPTSPSSVYRYIIWLGPVTILWAHFSTLMRVHCEFGGMGLDSFCLQLRQSNDVFLVFGPSGRLHCSRNVNPHGGQGNREAYFRDIRRGRTTSAFHGEAVSWRAESTRRREEAPGRRRQARK